MQFVKIKIPACPSAPHLLWHARSVANSRVEIAVEHDVGEIDLLQDVGSEFTLHFLIAIFIQLIFFRTNSIVLQNQK